MRKVILLILDGWGLSPSWGGNVIEMAETPNMDKLWRDYPRTKLLAAEEAVGLPPKEPGNSEVGHLNIGCGQAVYQNLPGINTTIVDGSFFENESLLETMEFAKKNNSNLHLLGLVSDGGVHSFNGHLYALLQMAKNLGLKKVFIQMITDGRDTDPMKALSYLTELETEIKEIGVGKVASISGRYFAMDRDNHWDRIQKVYDLLIEGIGEKAESAAKAIAENYRGNKTDEFIVPTKIETEKEPFIPIAENDAIIFFNFRAERIKQLTDAIIEDANFNKFHRKKVLKNLLLATFSFMEEYTKNSKIKIVFHEREIQSPLGKILADKGFKQLHLAETEKYAHVTFFFNGGKEDLFNEEKRILVASPKVATYDLKPEMSVEKVTDELLGNFLKFDFTVCNFANLDMVGHTGKIKATVLACEIVDKMIGKIVEVVKKEKAVLMITADHGNAEEMLNPRSGEPYTEHTTSPVPFILISGDPSFKVNLREESDLALKDIAPTILDIMEISEKPAEMTGKSLIKR